MARRGRRNGDQFKVYAAEGGFRVIQRTSLANAQLYEALKIWRREYDTVTGAHIGFRVIGAESKKVDSDLRSIQTAAAIDSAEMELNVERSCTAGLPEVLRLKRAKEGRLPEDEVERVQAKIAVYPHVGAAQGDILRVWPA
ncbi:hypothetical protein [Occallatibacter riparius]|uniref:Uncharacterized protein n=1 Tax=Occallatibacter riparius TaxID=1002689 RepID=A0A9J7BPW4_9BACT|nr:hypothetical protein [Occallatibacter riparius]UWZ84639.1 hypothetical protein MOP44_01590 [Occallatibacter riparius]